MNGGNQWSAGTIITLVLLGLAVLWGFTHKNTLKELVGHDSPAYPAQDKVLAAKLVGRLEVGIANVKETQMMLRNYLLRLEGGVGEAGDTFFSGPGRQLYADRRAWFSLRVEPWDLARESQALIAAAQQAKRELTSNPGKVNDWAALADEMETFCQQANASIRQKEVSLTNLLTRFGVVNQYP